ncbi:ATP-binding protein [Erythrobacter sp.]|uniref:sensor histidine kinase n=1 Tax=Erythrobacter sp. TaxID=1042 RepID=UPI001425F83D|nr:ATP-binding protein [Erythrobacter sp.]QIQ87297.1 MAG: two-component sensor histidine kinase [Erythrobacter sp.]
MAVLALGLLVAQAISATLLYRASEERREAAIVSSLAYRLIAEAGRSEGELAERAERRTARAARRAELRGERRGPPGLGPGAGRRESRRMRIGAERSSSPPLGPGEAREASYEASLRDVLAMQDIAAGRILVAERRAGEDPFIRTLVERRPRLRSPGWEDRTIVLASVERPGGEWITVRLPVPERPRGGLATILFQTAVIFAVLVLLLYLVLRRLTRPLAALTARLADFSRAPGRAEPLPESGPADTRRLIAAYNAMEARIAALIDEKDVMLGAIGHDLKTPLAALRVRIESVADEVQRERMAASIEDITATLDDILALARIGHADGAAEPVDLAALAGAVVEEFEDLGAPVELAEPEGAPRIVARLRETWAKRALRNLVSNAVRYGGGAKVTLRREGGAAVIAVEDEGPGIPADRIEAMMEPFARGEASRNRATGGAGLGLTLARSIAEAEGGSLSLANRAEGGLVAELRFPLA